MKEENDGEQGFVITYKQFTPPSNPMHVPLHVGRAMASDLGYLGDDTGDNISKLNDSWVELRTSLQRLYPDYAADFAAALQEYALYSANLMIVDRQMYDALQHIDDGASRTYLREHRFSEVALTVMLHYDLHSRYGCPPLDEATIRKYMDEETPIV